MVIEVHKLNDPEEVLDAGEAFLVGQPSDTT